jgi:Spy/CpxP family protein refolding chaperone
MLLCSLVLITQLYADDEHNKESERIYKNLDYLQLNKQQEDEIKKILIASKKEFKHFYKEKQEAYKKLQQIMQKEYFDKNKYEDIAEDIAEEAIELEIDIFRKIHSILTPAQRERFSKYLMEWKIE